MSEPNYVVTINGRKKFPADTEEEVWDIVGRHPFGSLYDVSSPVGLSVDEFVPF